MLAVRMLEKEDLKVVAAFQQFLKPVEQELRRRKISDLEIFSREAYLPIRCSLLAFSFSSRLFDLVNSTSISSLVSMVESQFHNSDER